MSRLTVSMKTTFNFTLLMLAMILPAKAFSACVLNAPSTITEEAGSINLEIMCDGVPIDHYGSIMRWTSSHPSVISGFSNDLTISYASVMESLDGADATVRISAAFMHGYPGPVQHTVTKQITVTNINNIKSERAHWPSNIGYLDRTAYVGVDTCFDGHKIVAILEDGSPKPVSPQWSISNSAVASLSVTNGIAKLCTNTAVHQSAYVELTARTSLGVHRYPYLIRRTPLSIDVLDANGNSFTTSNPFSLDEDLVHNNTHTVRLNLEGGVSRMLLASEYNLVSDTNLVRVNNENKELTTLHAIGGNQSANLTATYHYPRDTYPDNAGSYIAETFAVNIIDTKVRFVGLDMTLDQSPGVISQNIVEEGGAENKIYTLKLRARFDDGTQTGDGDGIESLATWIFPEDTIIVPDNVNKGKFSVTPVDAPHTVTIHANYEVNGTTKHASKEITIANSSRDFDYAKIAIPEGYTNGQIPELSTSDPFFLEIHYADEDSSFDTGVPAKSWTLVSPYASMSGDGIVNTFSVTKDEPATIKAEFEWINAGGATVSGTLSENIIINDTRSSIVGLDVVAPESVALGSPFQLEAIAHYDDGSSSNVNVIPNSKVGWRVMKGDATFNENNSGVLTANSFEDGGSIVVRATAEIPQPNTELTYTKSSLKEIALANPSTAEFELISKLPGNVQGSGNSLSAHLSESTGAVVFASDSANFSLNPYNIKNVFLASDTGLELITIGEANGSSYSPKISADGRIVVFSTDATNLLVDNVNEDANASTDVIVYDTILDKARYVSLSNGGDVGNSHSIEPMVSGNGGVVVFTSSASNLTSNAAEELELDVFSDIYIRDLANSITRRVSNSYLSMVDSSAPAVDGNSDSPSISSDGRFVVFRSDASNLIANDTNHKSDVFIVDLYGLVTRRLSTDHNGGQLDVNSYGPTISSDGEVVAYISESKDQHSQTIYIVDIKSNELTKLELPVAYRERLSSYAELSLSGDGRFLGFSATEEVSGVGPVGAVYVYDRFLQELELISKNGTGVAVGPSSGVSFSQNGDVVVFSSSNDALNVSPVDTNGKSDVYMARRDINQVATVWLTPSKREYLMPASEIIVDLFVNAPKENTIGGGVVINFDPEFLEYSHFEFSQENFSKVDGFEISPLINDGKLTVTSFADLMRGLSGSVHVGSFVFTGVSPGASKVSIDLDSQGLDGFFSHRSTLRQDVYFKAATVFVSTQQYATGISDRWLDSYASMPCTINGSVSTLSKLLANPGLIPGLVQNHDCDGDEISLLDEYTEFLISGVSTNPMLGDTDNDGIRDEIDPCPLDALNIDTDADGVCNSVDLDDDNDGMPDIYENSVGLNALVDDRGGDADGDHLLNIDEFVTNRNPNSYDSLYMFENAYFRDTAFVPYSSHDSTPYDIQVDHEGNFLLTGGEGVGLKIQGWVEKRDKDWTLIWEKKFTGSGQNRYSLGKMIEVASDGSVYVAGVFNDVVDFGNGQVFSSNGWPPYLIKMDPENGDVLWAKIFYGEESPQLRDLHVSHDNTIYIAYSDVTTGNVRKAIINKYDDNVVGNSLWTSSFTGGSSDYGIQLSTSSLDSDHLYVGVAYTTHNHYALPGIVYEGAEPVVLPKATSVVGQPTASTRDLGIIKLSSVDGTVVDVLDRKLITSLGDVHLNEMLINQSGDLIIAGNISSPTQFDVGYQIGGYGKQGYVAKMGLDLGAVHWATTAGADINDVNFLHSNGDVTVVGDYRSSLLFNGQKIPDVPSRMNENNDTSVDAFVGQFSATGEYKRFYLSAGSNSIAGCEDGLRSLVTNPITGDMFAVGYLNVRYNSTPCNPTTIDLDPSHNNGNETIKNLPENTSVGVILAFNYPHDIDGDGYVDVIDIFPMNPSEWLDTNHNGIGNNTDLDDDGDGIPDVYEELYSAANNPNISGQPFLDPLIKDGDGDSDSDGVSNLNEYLGSYCDRTNLGIGNASSNPLVKDTDVDGVNDGADPFRLDPWESFNNDDDCIGNNADTDDDNDGIPDVFEDAYANMDSLVNDAHLDLDLDDLNNHEEYFYEYDGIWKSTNPDEPDTDSDGLSDGDEVAVGTNAHNPDTDNDGMPDGWEIKYGLAPLPLDAEGANDANLDKDFDGKTNLEEYLAGTDPTDDGMMMIIPFESSAGSGVFDRVIVLP